VQTQRCEVGLYKIFVHFEAFLHESIILVLPPPTCIAHNSAIRLHVYCTLYDLSRTPPCVCHTPCNIGNAISCKGLTRCTTRALRLRRNHTATRTNRSSSPSSRTLARIQRCEVGLYKSSSSRCCTTNPKN